MRKRIAILASAICVVCVCAVLCVHFIQKNGANENASSAQSETPAPSAADASATLETADASAEDAWVKTVEYNQTEGNVNYAAKVANPNVQSVYMPSVALHDLSSDEIFKTIIEKCDYDYPEEWKEDTEGYNDYINADGTKVYNTSKKGLEYWTDPAYRLELVPTNQLELIYLYPEEEFSWGTRDDCARKAVEIMNTLGIQAKVDKVYSISADLYEEIYAYELPYMEEDLKIGMTKFYREHIDHTSDEMFYVAILKQTANDIPMYNRYTYSSTKLEYIDGPEICVIFSEKGVERISITEVVDETAQGESTPVISFEKAVEIFNDHINNQTLIEEPIKIIYVGLEYLPDRSIDLAAENGTNATMKPIWLFRAEKAHEAGYSSQDEVINDYFIDAITGQVIIG